MERHKVYEGFYRVSNLGKVFSVRTNKLLSQWKDKDGYLRCNLKKHSVVRQASVHRLVAEAFIPNPENKPQVNHKDGNKKNNNVSNLEWATNSENGLHSFRVLKRKPAKAMLGRFGKNSPVSKIVLQIKDGHIVAEFYGGKEAERETGVFCSNISACCCGKIKSAGGYQWKYKGC